MARYDYAGRYNKRQGIIPSLAHKKSPTGSQSRLSSSISSCAFSIGSLGGLGRKLGASISGTTLSILYKITRWHN
jgi:hypothetical protein